MKKNTKNVEKIKKDFLAELNAVLKGLDKSMVIPAEPSGFDRKSFGWSLYLSSTEGQNYLSVVPPRHKLETSHGNFICLSENLGLLEIKIKVAGAVHSYERECHQRLPQSGQLRSYFKSIYDCICPQNEQSQLKRTALVYMLSSLFTELVFDASHLDDYMKDPRRQMMIKINSSINARVGTAFSAQDIAEDLSYSLQHLNKISQDFRGLSLNNYINFYKLEVFRSKLLLGKDKISELAGVCGFRDVNYLIQLFKKTYFITPLQLRKQIRDSSFEGAISLHKTAGFEVLKPIAKPSFIPPLSVKDKRCSLVFGNLNSEALELYWISPEKEEVPMGLLTGLDRIHFGSVEGHVWLLRKGKRSAYFKVGKNNCLIVF
ncbi:MAG: helix-turn-helix domain-containing protein [Lentisphaeraceae bacterium]|nr:helix-turn-helix domain-containing protein [Lentisphaeraceae bacterium]